MQHGIDSHLTAASTAQSHCGTHSHMKREPGGEGGGGRCRARTGTLCVIRVLGFMMVTSWCSRSGWDTKSSGASLFITFSSCSAAYPGTPYQVFGSPLEIHHKINVQKHLSVDFS